MLRSIQGHNCEMKTVEMTYLAKQGEFLRNCADVPYSGYIGGFGSGKTHILIIQALRLASIPSRGLIGAPTYRMLEDTTQWKFFELTPPSWIKSFSKRRNSVTLVNGSEILFRSMERPGRLAGLELDWFGIDEAGEVKLETFRMLQGRMKISKIRKGFAVGNPAGPVHWTYDYFVTLAAEHPEVYRLVQAASFENIYLDESYIRDMEVSFGKDTVYYKQYVLGQFVAFEGALWPNFDARPYPEGHVMSRDDVRDFIRGGGVHWGRVIDFGFEHPFVCLWYVTNGVEIIFFDEYCQRHGLIKAHCQEMRKREKEHQLIYGPHNYGPAYTDHEAVSRAEMEAEGFTCIPVEKKVMESVLLVQSLFGQRQLFVTSDCKQTLREIPSYHSKEGIAGEEPVRENEDTCCCIRYACWAEMRRHQPYRRCKGMGYELAGKDTVFEMQVM